MTGADLASSATMRVPSGFFVAVQVSGGEGTPSAFNRSKMIPKAQQPMTSAISRPLGAFPIIGPVTYLQLTPEEARLALEQGPYPEVRRWFHATAEEVASIALRYGLVPGCWLGGDTCAVFGRDSIHDFPTYRQNAWFLEVESEALPDQLRAFWVPHAAINHVWHHGLTVNVAASNDQPRIRGGCSCELSNLCREEQARWRRSWDRSQS